MGFFLYSPQTFDPHFIKIPIFDLGFALRVSTVYVFLEFHYKWITVYYGPKFIPIVSKMKNVNARDLFPKINKET